MNKDEQILTDLTHFIKDNERAFYAKDFLTERGVPESEQDSYIEEAHTLLNQKHTQALSMRYKIIFWGAFTLIFFTLFIYPRIMPRLFPEMNTLFTILGTIVCLFATAIAIIHYKRWKPENILRESEHDHDPDYSIFIPVLAVPAVCFWFFISWNLESAEDGVLQRKGIQTMATVVSENTTQWRSIRRRGPKIHEVLVKFQTRSGKVVYATEEISRAEKEKFYPGKQIPIIYVPTDPENIELLTNSSDIKEYTGSEERKILPTDLLRIMTMPAEQVLDTLKKISFGWEYSANASAWENTSKQMVMLRSEGQLSLFSPEYLSKSYPPLLEKMGFKRLTEGGIINPYAPKDILFESPIYTVSIRLIPKDNVLFHQVSIQKK